MNTKNNYQTKAKKKQTMKTTFRYGHTEKENWPQNTCPMCNNKQPSTALMSGYTSAPDWKNGSPQQAGASKGGNIHPRKCAS